MSQKCCTDYITDAGGNDNHLSSASTEGWDLKAVGSAHYNSPAPPFATTAATTAAKSIYSPHQTISPPFNFNTGATVQPQTAPSATGFNPSGIVATASPILPGPIPCESPNKGGGSFFPQQPLQQQAPIATPPVVTAVPSQPASSSRKRRATADPEGAPLPHNDPPAQQPLFPSLQTSQSTELTSSAGVASFGFGNIKAPAPTKRTNQHSGSGASGGGGAPLAPIPKPPLFGSLFSSSNGASSAADSGAPAASSSAAAANDPASKPFAALFGSSSTGMLPMLHSICVASSLLNTLGPFFVSASAAEYFAFGIVLFVRLVWVSVEAVRLQQEEPHLVNSCSGPQQVSLCLVPPCLPQ
jgi:hypothetical protein